MKDDDLDAKNSSGKIDRNGEGKLKITRLWPFSAKYWVLAVGPTYDWALIGGPDHKSLWVLSRAKSVSSEVFTEIKKKAQAEGFDTAKLLVK